MGSKKLWSMLMSGLFCVALSGQVLADEHNNTIHIDEENPGGRYILT